MTYFRHDWRVALKRIGNSLVTRLLLMGLLALSVGTLLTYVQLTRFLREDLTQVVSAQQLALAKYIARDIDDDLSDRLGFLDRLAQALPRERLSQPEALSRWLNEQEALRPVFSLGLRVVDPSDESPDSAKIGRPTTAAASGKSILPFFAPVRDASGKTLAVLIGTAELSSHGFLERLMQGRIGESGGILLISPADKVFVASTRSTLSMKPTPAPGINALHDRAMAGFRGAGTTVNAFGVEEISAIASVPSTGWFVVARLPTKEALATVARTQSFILQQRLPAVLVVLVVICLIVTYLLRPLFRAADQAEKMTRGEMALTPFRVVRNDELGYLTSSFNRLLVKLGDHERELAQLAYYDNLTGLPNRKMLADRLEQALARAQRKGTRVVVLFLDLNGFKRINDSLGHEAGDEVLRQVARRLSGVVRRSDTVARLGGDEFVVLADDLEHDHADSARTLAEKCIDTIAAPLQLRGASHALGVSIGIASSSGAESAEQLLAMADRAMYTVKQRGAAGYALAAVAA